MAMAIPIVSTSAGIRGFSLKDGQSVLLGDTSDEFASHVINLLRDGERRDSVGKAAREVALSTIDWGVLGRRLVGIVDEAQRKINHAIRQTSVNTQ
jgi:glycosyltransferase involved in cell wall biosynthesis